MAVTLKGYTANYLGLSTDAKPTEADDNAIFRELDTGKRYYFTGAAWAEIPSSGGGGGGDVTSVNGKTGAVTLTASDVGAYTTTETDTLLGGKADKVRGASAGDLAGVDSNGNLTDSGINSAVIPSTAATSNKLSTAADTAKEDITATANSEDIALTDSTDARVHDLKIYGKTVDDHSVGENGLTVTATGKNILKLTRLSTQIVNGVTFEPRTDGGIYVHGTVIEEGGKSYAYYSIEQGSLSMYNKHKFSVDGINGSETNNNFEIGFQLNDSPWSSYATITDSSQDLLIDFGQYANANKRLRILVREIGTTVDTIIYPMIRDAKFSNRKYEPYKGNSLTVNTAKPYRGILRTIDMGDLNWNYYATGNDGASYPRFISSIPDGVFVRSGMQEYISCSSRYTPNMLSVFNDMYTVDKTIAMGSSGAMFVIDHEYTDVAAYKAAVTGITLTYPSYCDEIDLADGIAITRLDSNGDVLATPVTTPLTTAEKAAFAEFRTFDGNTNVTATDNPFMSMVYVKNTDNGKALADVDNRIEETFTAAEKAKLAGIATGATANTVIDTTCTLTVAGWTGAAAPYTQTVNVTGILATDRPMLDLSVSSTVATGIDEIDDWALISKAETGAGTITFSCYEDIPTTELTVNVKVVR